MAITSFGPSFARPFAPPFPAPRPAAPRLQARLLVVLQEQNAKRVAEIRGDLVKAEWGQQIRNYGTSGSSSSSSSSSRARGSGKGKAGGGAGGGQAGGGQAGGRQTAVSRQWKKRGAGWELSQIVTPTHTVCRAAVVRLLSLRPHGPHAPLTHQHPTPPPPPPAVFHPYKLVKDTRTGTETSDVQVLGGGRGG